jgi:hypothetical protein
MFTTDFRPTEKNKIGKIVLLTGEVIEPAYYDCYASKIPGFMPIKKENVYNCTFYLNLKAISYLRVSEAAEDIFGNIFTPESIKTIKA